MVGAISIIEGVLVDFLTHLLLNIGGEPTREALIDMHRVISGNLASVASDLGGGRNVDLVLTMKDD